MDIFFQIIQNTYFAATALLIVALGGLLAERSGVTNIALEGIMLMGAFVGIWVVRLLEFDTQFPTQVIYLIGLVTGAAVGAVFAMIHAHASIYLKANQIISATALNLFAPAFAIFTARIVHEQSARYSPGSQVQFKSVFMIQEVPFLSDIPIIGELFFTRVFVSFYLAIAALIIVSVVLNKTRFGLRLKACGENPHAADSLGINIYRMRFVAVTLSGLLAGMGGVMFVATTSTEFNASVAGFGFLAIAVLIFGNWRPSRIVFAALFFGLMRTIGSFYTVIPFLKNLGLPREIYQMMPYIATLIVLAFFSKRSRAPKALGQVYDQGKR
ncbi:MAG: ABC transporter permease [Acholeplasmataceae bacterium]|nr:ABC transporter permease [Acholeplasmataceae bacterium]